MSHNFKLMNFYKKYWYIFWFIIYGLLFAISVLFVNILSVSKLFTQLIIIGFIIGIFSRMIYLWIHKKVININFNLFIWILLYVILLFIFEFVLSYIKTSFIWEIVIIGILYTLIVYLLKKIKFKTLSIIVIISGLLLLIAILYQGDNTLNNKQVYFNSFANISEIKFTFPKIKLVEEDTPILLTDFFKEFNGYTDLEKEEYWTNYVGKTVIGQIGVSGTAKDGSKFIVYGGTNYYKMKDNDTRYFFMPGPDQLKIYFNDDKKTGVLSLQAGDIVYIKAKLNDYRYYIGPKQYNKTMDQLKLINGEILSKGESGNYHNEFDEMVDSVAIK